MTMLQINYKPISSDDNPGVDDLQVEVKDGVATIKGKAKSASAYEKAVLMAGNALGIEEVTR